MKVEEMAEEYFESTCLHSYADTEEELKEDVVAAFIAGLKAGRPQWHDLRKDPTDLPDSDRNVWVKRESEIECQIDNYYEDDKGWGIMFREGYCADDVIAWCEIPTFDKEIDK